MSARPTSICVAADTVALRCTEERGLEVLLVRRRNEPFKGGWALPGGFVDDDEDLPRAAARELAEETGLEPVLMEQVGAWGTPGRDPRGRTVSVVYLALAAVGRDAVQGGDDAAEAAWHAVSSLPPLAFDHGDIVPAALERLRCRCERTHMALAFLPESFRAEDLARVLGALGCAGARTGAERLLGVACVKTLSDGRLRVNAAEPATPLREPVFLFHP